MLIAKTVDEVIVTNCLYEYFKATKKKNSTKTIKVYPPKRLTSKKKIAEKTTSSILSKKIKQLWKIRTEEDYFSPFTCNLCLSKVELSKYKTNRFCDNCYEKRIRKEIKKLIKIQKTIDRLKYARQDSNL